MVRSHVGSRQQNLDLGGGHKGSLVEVRLGDKDYKAVGLVVGLDQVHF